ncbi:MAG: hypothetical protein WA766_13380 [Candidatus Acidiferrales bacterium]
MRLLAVIVAAALIASVVTFVLVLYLAPSLPANSGPGKGSPSQIDLLPSPGTKSACIVGTPGVPRPTLPLDNGTFQGNTYSVPNGTVGHVGMCYSSEDGSLFAYANWSHVGAPGGWFSYPQVAYGVNDYLGEYTTYTNQSPAWELPQTVSTVVNTSLWVTASYDFNAPSPADTDGYDLSFDNFFSEGLPPTIEVPPFVEVEVFLAHNISYSFHYAHWSTDTLVNGTVSVEPWDVGYWCHGVDNGSNGNISFDFSYGGQSTRGLKQGTIGMNLSAFLAEVEAMMPSTSCWTGPSSDFSQFYLGEQDLGSEDGALAGEDFNYNWTVASYCFDTYVKSPSVANLTCSSREGAIPSVLDQRLGVGNLQTLCLLSTATQPAARPAPTDATSD